MDLRNRIAAGISALLLAVATACEGGGGTGGAGGASSTATDGSSDAATGTSSGETAASSTSASTGGPVDACADIQASECFSSYDCPDQTTRCENVGAADAPVACCVPGARGAGLAGDPCAGENDCKSSLCVEVSTGNVCTDICTSPNECPMPPFTDCIEIAFSGSTDEFCVP